MAQATNIPALSWEAGAEALSKAEIQQHVDLGGSDLYIVQNPDQSRDLIILSASGSSVILPQAFFSQML